MNNEFEKMKTFELEKEVDENTEVAKIWYPKVATYVDDFPFNQDKPEKDPFKLDQLMSKNSYQII